MAKIKKTGQKRGIIPGDSIFLILFMLILCIGLLSLFSASYAYGYAYQKSNYDSYYYIKKQLVFVGIGAVGFIFTALINYKAYKNKLLVMVANIITISLLLIVLATNGDDDGVKRWIYIGGLTIQPSEIAKFTMIYTFAYFFSAGEKKLNTIKGVLLPIFFALVTLILILCEPHYSAMLIIALVIFVMALCSGIKKRYVIGTYIAGGGMGLLYLLLKKTYISEKISIMLDPYSDPDKGRQIIQSLIAIGSGGLFGRGIAQSRQKYLWLPEPQNDFIFSIICEEIGFLGAVGIIILFLVFVFRGIVIGCNAPDKFGFMLSLGLIFQIGLQVVINILVVLNLFPNTGVSLPFFSAGGSSVIVLMTSMGIIYNISTKQNEQNL